MADPLLRALAARDQRGVARALRGRSEAERRGVAAACLHEPDDNGAAGLALLGTATLGQIRRRGAWSLSLVDDALAATVLLDRRPGWLASWAAWILRGDTLEPKWPIVRTLVREGAIERPEDARYFDGLLATSRGYETGAAQLIAQDRRLLEHDLWDLILHGGDQDSLTAADAAGAGWSTVLRRNGDIARERVLDTVLDALTRDVSAYRSSWYTGLWREFDVTADERAARVALLRTLLGAAAAPVVGFAVEELGRVEPLPPGLEAELAPALTAPAKKTVRAALKLLDRAEGESRAAVATLALVHEAADIQGDVLGRLERWGVDDDARRGLLRHLDLLAATQRPRAEALLGVSLPEDEPEASPDLDARIAALPAEIRTALDVGGPVPVAPVDGEPVLGEALAPIGSLEELADAFADAAPEPWYVRDERLLDGILRHCGSREAFDGPLRPYVPLLQTLSESQPGSSVLHVAGAWLTGTSFTRRRMDTMARRIVDAADRAARGAPAPLLALPTHAGGWIAPATLVERVRAVGEDADETELAQALLRLAPEGRAHAAADAADLPGRPGAIVRCALGGADVPGDRSAALAARSVRRPPLTDVRLHVAFAGDDVDVVREPAGALDGPVGEYLTRATGEEEPHGRFALEPLAWPSRRDVACVCIYWHVRFNLRTGAPTFEAASSVLGVLMPAGEALSPPALRLITLALCSSSDREHLAAADLLIAAIEDGRIDAPALAPALREDLAAGLLLTNRLGPRLLAVAGAGPLVRAVVRDVLDGAAAGLAALPARSHGDLLVPLDELCEQTGARVASEPARAFLTTLKGSSRAAKAAKALLARDGNPPEAERQLALAARLRRAERWAERS